MAKKGAPRSAAPAAKAPRKPDYDVCLSFAGEDRAYVERVARALRNQGVRVFFDEYEQVGMWGKDLYTHLDDVYQRLARYCVVFVSKHYAERVWTNHERRSAQARALRENREYILPARFDDTELPGLPATVAYISLRGMSPGKLAALIAEKVKPAEDGPRKDYFPPVPDRLYEALGAKTQSEREELFTQAYWFFRALRRMDEDERRAVLTVFSNTCPVGPPDDVHMNVDLVRRLTGFSVARIKRLLGGVSSLRVYAEFDDGSEHGEDNVHLTFHSLDADHGGPATEVAERAVALASEGYCEEHSAEQLMNLNFSNLATVTFTKERPHRKTRGRRSAERANKP